MRRNRRLWGSLHLALAVVGSIATAGSAQAFCQAMTCDRTKDSCAIDEHGCVLEGAPLHWKNGAVAVDVDSAGSPLRGISAEDAESTVSAALSTWKDAVCPDGRHPSLHVAPSRLVEGAEVDFDPDGTNDNVVVFHNDSWAFQANAVAKTLLGFTIDTGELANADIAVNAAEYPYSIDPSAEEIDLLAVLTHEIGHLLGLDHSDVSGATMEPETRGFGTVDLRTLSADDTEAICTVYPPEGTEVAEPAAEAESGCAVSSRTVAGDTNGRAVIACAALLLSAVLIRRRRDPRSRRG